MFQFSTKAQQTEAWLFLEIVWQGLEYLHQQVQRMEVERGLTENFSYSTFGSEEGDAMVCNYFLWYANALYNFIGVFKKAFSPSENLEDEFRAVITWRHKVAAHTSWARPKRDNVATQDASILLFPDVNAGHFEVGGLVLASEKGDASCSEWHWGLVCTHEKLRGIVGKYV
jgi:hypothetical protein